MEVTTPTPLSLLDSIKSFDHSQFFTGFHNSHSDEMPSIIQLLLTRVRQTKNSNNLYRFENPRTFLFIRSFVPRSLNLCNLLLLFASLLLLASLLLCCYCFLARCSLYLPNLQVLNSHIYKLPLICLNTLILRQHLVVLVVTIFHY